MHYRDRAPSLASRPVSYVWKPFLLCVAVAVAVDGDDCSSAGSLKAAIAGDEDLPLSLVQVKAVATRNNKTQQVNQSLSIAEVMPNAALVKLGAPAGSWLVEAAPTLLMAFESLRIFYVSFAILVLVLLLNSSWLCAHFQRQEKGEKESVPKIRHSVDHLVATSKLERFTPESKSNQLQFYSRSMRNNDGFCKGASAAHCLAGQDLKFASTPTPEEPSLADKPQSTHEALDAKLVLPLRETWYAVDIEKVLKSSGSFEILRITGCPSLRACVCYGNDCGGALELFCCAGGSTNSLLARVTTRSLEVDQIGRANGNGESKAPRLSLTLVDAEEKCLGELRPITATSFELFCNHEVVMTLAIDDAGQLEVSSAGGSKLACVSCLAGHLGICVNAGADTGLLVCVVLAAVLLGGAAAHVLQKGSHSTVEVCRASSDEEICQSRSA